MPSHPRIGDDFRCVTMRVRVTNKGVVVTLCQGGTLYFAPFAVDLRVCIEHAGGFSMVPMAGTFAGGVPGIACKNSGVNLSTLASLGIVEVRLFCHAAKNLLTPSDVAMYKVNITSTDDQRLPVADKETPDEMLSKALSALFTLANPEVREALEKVLLRPQIVSSFLGIKPSELYRETVNLIGKPAQPAAKQGARTAYLVKELLLMKLGRVLRDLGISPHRVRECIEQVRSQWEDLDPWPVLTFPIEDGIVAFHRKNISLFLIGYETESGFRAELLDERQFIRHFGIILDDETETEAWKNVPTSFPAPEWIKTPGEYRFYAGPVRSPVLPNIVIDLRKFMIQNIELLRQHMESMKTKP